VLVTDRGEVIAEIFPPGQVNSVERMTQRYPEAFDGISPGLLALAREHGAKLPTRKNDPSLYPTLPAVMSSEEIAKLLDETRGGH
jgi:hypothetical protein